MRHHRRHRAAPARSSSVLLDGLRAPRVPRLRLGRRGPVGRRRRRALAGPGGHGTRSLDELARSSRTAPPGVTAGIGHTRWATHGHPTEENAHPHLDCTGRVAVVHNGIIENHASWPTSWWPPGHVCVSETDTEVFAHLIEEELAAGPCRWPTPCGPRSARCGAPSPWPSVRADEPDAIVAARRVVAAGDGHGRRRAALLASDIPALLGRTRRFWVLDDDQVVELRPGSIRVTDLRRQGGRAHRAARRLGPRGGPEGRLRRLHEQGDPRAAPGRGRHPARPAAPRRDDRPRRAAHHRRRAPRRSTRSSSWPAAPATTPAWWPSTPSSTGPGCPTEIDIASEFRYRDPVLDRRTLVVGVSQSGETIDTLQAMREARQWDAKVLVISNVVDSSMAREADGVLYTRAGPEMGVASTKTPPGPDRGPRDPGPLPGPAARDACAGRGPRPPRRPCGELPGQGRRRPSDASRRGGRGGRRFTGRPSTSSSSGATSATRWPSRGRSS